MKSANADDTNIAIFSLARRNFVAAEVSARVGRFGKPQPIGSRPHKTAILFRMDVSIPTDARNRALAVLRELEERLMPLFDSVEEGSNSAIAFRMPEQP